MPSVVAEIIELMVGVDDTVMTVTYKQALIAIVSMVAIAVIHRYMIGNITNIIRYITMPYRYVVASLSTKDYILFTTCKPTIMVKAFAVIVNIMVIGVVTKFFY